MDIRPNFALVPAPKVSVVASLPIVIDFRKYLPQSILQAGNHGPSSFTLYGTVYADKQELTVDIVSVDASIKATHIGRFTKSIGYEGASPQLAIVVGRLFKRPDQRNWPVLFLGSLWLQMNGGRAPHATSLLPDPKGSKRELIGQYELPQIFSVATYYALVKPKQSK